MSYDPALDSLDTGSLAIDRAHNKGTRYFNENWFTCGDFPEQTSDVRQIEHFHRRHTHHEILLSVYCFDS